MKKSKLMGLVALCAAGLFTLKIDVQAAGYSEIGEYGRPGVLSIYNEQDDEILEEERLGDMELIAQLVEAEAGNQSFEGKCLVVDVVLNRLESEDFPNTVSDVIFQDGQFSVVKNGAFEKAAWNMKEDDYRAVEYEVSLHSNKEVLYFNNCSMVGGSGIPFKVGGHYFNS